MENGGNHPSELILFTMDNVLGLSEHITIVRDLRWLVLLHQVGAHLRDDGLGDLQLLLQPLLMDEQLLQIPGIHGKFPKVVGEEVVGLDLVHLDIVNVDRVVADEGAGVLVSSWILGIMALSDLRRNVGGCFVGLGSIADRHLGLVHLCTELRLAFLRFLKRLEKVGEVLVGLVVGLAHLLVRGDVRVMGHVVTHCFMMGLEAHR